MKAFSCSLKVHTQRIMGAVLAAFCLIVIIPSAAVFAQEPSNVGEVQQEDTTNLFTKFFEQGIQCAINLVENKQNPSYTIELVEEPQISIDPEVEQQRMKRQREEQQREIEEWLPGALRRMGISEEQIPIPTKSPTLGPELDGSLGWLSQIVGKPITAWPVTPLWPQQSKSVIKEND
ncbi:MAG: hypothetical protein HFJ84_08230 [Clostridiales bacterium]|jgi:hypothetical protein|nr:hypothetical protein [Clostridiales bacterium]